jgi:4-hydroxy-tetrahydrodipicolinate synthase
VNTIRKETWADFEYAACSPRSSLHLNQICRRIGNGLLRIAAKKLRSRGCTVMSENNLRGVLAPVTTPFKPDLSVDSERFIEHCRWLVAQNCGLAVFGTNSEANSMSFDERAMLLDELVAAGVDPARMMPGTGCCSIIDTVRLTAQAVNHGCAGVLMLPPFYYKDVSEEGLYRYFSEVVQRVGDARLRIYLYHIPPVAMVGITPKLVERLLAAYPSAIAGMKDSSGDWNNTRMFLDAFVVRAGRAVSTAGAARTFDVFVGSESFLLANMRHGGVGTISATANVNPAAISSLFAKARDEAGSREHGAESQKSEIRDQRSEVSSQTSKVRGTKSRRRAGEIKCRP